MNGTLETVLLDLLRTHDSLGNAKARELLGCDEATVSDTDNPPTGALGPWQVSWKVLDHC